MLGTKTLAENILICFASSSPGFSSTFPPNTWSTFGESPKTPTLSCYIRGARTRACQPAADDKVTSSTPLHVSVPDACPEEWSSSRQRSDKTT